MGWFGKGALDGDIGMDCRSKIFFLLNLDYNKSTSSEIISSLTENLDIILDWLRDYDWNKEHSHNPGLVQQYYIQATYQILLDFDVRISDRMMKAIPFIENDYWAKENRDRQLEMEKLFAAVILSNGSTYPESLVA